MPELFHEQEVRASLRERQHGVAVPVHDEVHLPVAEACPVGFRRTFVYAHPVADVRGLGFVPAESLAPVFHPVAAMGGELAAPVLANYRVNGLVRDAYALPLQTAGYLPWRPLLVPYQFNDAPFQHIVQFSVSGCADLPGICLAMGLVPHVLAVSCGVASDSRLMEQAIIFS